MKKITALLLALVMLLSLCACAKESPADEPTTMGQQLFKSFAALVNDGQTDVQAMADTLMHSGILPFDALSMEVEPGYLMGFTTEIDGFEKAVMFGPAIGSIPFVAYVFEMDSKEVSEDFCGKLLECCDPRWNICVEADETVCGSEDKYVFFVMCSNEQSEAE